MPKGVYIRTEQHGHNLSIANKGKRRSEDTKRRMKEASQGKNNSMYGKTHNPETRDKISEAMHKVYLDNKIRQKISTASKRLWQTPDYIRKQMKSRRVTPNKPELNLDSILQKYFPNEWKYVGNGEVIIGRKCPDFININGRKQIIELFGNYWHFGLFCEAEKIYHYKQYGFDCLIIWETEIKNKSETEIIRKVKEGFE